MLLSAKDVNKTDVAIGIKTDEDIGSGVVYAMKDNTGHDAVSAIVHPAKQQTNSKGVDHLCRIKVRHRKEKG